MDIYQLSEYCQIKAISLAIDPDAGSIYRLKCREYSLKFHTPLHVVVNELDPIFVLQHLYEDQYSPSIIEDELEDLLEKLYKMKDPNYSKVSREDTEALVDMVLNREIQRASRNKAPDQETIQNDILKEKIKEIKKPKSGSLSFDSLQKIDSENEFNKSNF